MANRGKAIKNANNCINGEMSLTKQTFDEIGVTFHPINIPMVYNKGLDTEMNFLGKNVQKIINDMKTNLSKNTTPAELAMKLFKESNIPFKEITQGNQVPTLTTQIRERGAKPFKSDTDNKKYQEYQDVYTNVTSKLSQINTEVEALPDLISPTPTAQTQQVQQKHQQA